jgi:hypothetical protein
LKKTTKAGATKRSGPKQSEWNDPEAVDEFMRRSLSPSEQKWLMQVNPDWIWGPMNNYCKWFHVREHESNHNGQIKWIKGRLAV